MPIAEFLGGVRFSCCSNLYQEQCQSFFFRCICVTRNLKGKNMHALQLQIAKFISHYHSSLPNLHCASQTSPGERNDAPCPLVLPMRFHTTSFQEQQGSSQGQHEGSGPPCQRRETRGTGPAQSSCGLGLEKIQRRTGRCR